MSRIREQVFQHAEAAQDERVHRQEETEKLHQVLHGSQQAEKKKARNRKKPRFGGTPATFTELNSKGRKKRTPDRLDSDETKLYWTLMEWRTNLAKSNGVESYYILPNQTLYGLVEASRNDAFLLEDVSGLGGEV